MTKKVVRIRFPLPADYALRDEIMFAIPLGGCRYQLSNIPFYVYNLNLDDIVYAAMNDADCLPVYLFTELRSGNQTMRVFFPVAPDNNERRAFVGQMNRLAAKIEWADEQLCALSLSTPVFETVFEALLKLEKSGVLWFETTERACY